MAVPVESKGYMRNLSGSVGASWTSVSISNTLTCVLVKNTHSTQYLRVRGSGQTAYFTLEPGDAVAIETVTNSIELYGEAAGTTYEIIYTEL